MSRPHVDLHHRHFDQPGDSLAGTRQAHDRAFDPLAEVRRQDRSADRHAHRLHDAHGAAVVRGSWHALVAVDMPFGSYEASPEQAFQSASRIMKETGCAAVKLEGGEAMAPTVEFLTHRGIPVIGHVGLTPQAVNVLGGYGARGKDEREADKIERDALAVDQAGAFCIVVEGVMEEIASSLVGQLGAPVIGIGASADCDGQVLVTEDMLGLFERTPRFVKRYADLASEIGEAAARYAQEVRSRAFPGSDQTYRPKA